MPPVSYCRTRVVALLFSAPDSLLSFSGCPVKRWRRVLSIRSLASVVIYLVRSRGLAVQLLATKLTMIVSLYVLGETGELLWQQPHVQVMLSMWPDDFEADGI